MTESSLPSNVGTGTVVGKFVTAQKGVSGTPVTVPIVGSVIFTPTPSRLLDAASTPPTIILPQPVTVTLDAAGAFTVDLVATDDADLNPIGWNYKVSFNFTGVKTDSFNINVPQGTTVDLATASPVAAAGGTLITRGIGVPDTTGVTTGDVVTWNGTAIAWEAPTGGSGGATTLDGLTDVNTSGVADGQALVYDTGTSSWSVGSIVQPGDLATIATTGSADNLIDGTTNKAYTAAEKTKLAAITGTNTGDETATTIKTKLGITTLSGSNTGDQTSVTGNAGTATKLATARAINGVSFDGSADITVADATKVPTTRLVAGHALSADVTLAKADVGLGSVDNTADTAKPVSTAQQTALNLKANTSSLAAVATSGSAADLSAGLLPVARSTAGITLTVISTTSWPARPTARTDVFVRWLDAGGLGTTPAGMLDGDTLLAAS